MPSVAVLYISDLVVGPHLELLRLLADPRPQSRPHVTVRYFDRLRIPDAYRTTKIGHVDLVGVDRFDDAHARRTGNHTVFVRCASDELTPLEHKPHFPTSEFHITIYDGPSASFGRQVLERLSAIDWGLRVELPADTTLSSVPIRPRHHRRRERLGVSKTATELFQSITGGQLTIEDVVHVPKARRLSLLGLVCEHLSQATLHSLRLSTHSRPDTAQVPSDSTKDTVSEVHLTPPELARDIAAYAVSALGSQNESIDFGDPAVGTGAFYSALLQVVPRGQVHSALGFDVNESQVIASAARWAHRGLVVRKGDYLHLEELPARNLILANPPYLRHQRIPREYKQALRERASIRSGFPINARAGAYVYFMLLSHDWMAPDAVGAWLVPSEFMQTDYGEALRWYLTHRVTLMSLHQFDNASPQFENAKALPAVVVFKNRPPTADGVVSLTCGGTLASPRRSQSTSVAQLRRENRWSIPLRRYRPPSVDDIHIENLFTVKRGIATGANDFFVMTRTKAVSLGIPKAAMRPILPKVKTLESDVVNRDAEGYPRLSPQLVVLDCELSEEIIARKYPKLLEYLRQGKAQGLLKRNLVQSRQPWYRQERREPAPFLCTYMGRGSNGGPPIRFILNHSDAIATNTYLMLYPKSALAALLERHPELEGRLFKLLQQSAKETMAEAWRVHAGGLHKIEPGDLREVRMASTPNWLRSAAEHDLPLVSEPESSEPDSKVDHEARKAR